jgi:SWI/SNF-related matrix-associated actin-dependent regulator 1 of chromatin subfamily A
MFAHHTRVQKALAEAFGDQAVALRGGMDAMAKKRAVSTFMEDPDVRVFVASLGAGGVGIDGLQRVADTVAFVEYAWTPGEMQQAEDRVHRMFQDSDSVVIHHFVAVDTIDVDFQETLAAKQLVLDAVLGDGDNEEQAAKARGANVFGAIERALRAKAEGV